MNYILDTCESHFAYLQQARSHTHQLQLSVELAAPVCGTPPT